MTTTHSLLTRLLGTATASRDYKLAENYVLLRKAVFATTPDSVGIVDGNDANRVWGLVMECGYPETVASLVVFADGTVSLYFSNGGGMIGLGSHEGPQRAARALLKIAPRFLGYCDPTTKYPLPLKQHVSFYLFGQDGIQSSEAREADMSCDAHPLSPLFHIAHELITEIRILDRKRHA
ncbi:MAG TPA: hypothetical protein VNJ12_04330 [Candidatus Dormibacteraeota bacterium]|nr:hypothetical protein [Candidatus Dormibacteraeota bacterium]